MKGVICARYSSDNQCEKSIEEQLRECKAFAEKNDIQIVETYIDRALSARTDRRPDFQRMIKDSAGRKFEVVIVWKLDRFARDKYDSAHYKRILKNNGVKVVSATEAISAGAEGILLESMLEGMAEYYSAELSEKVTRGLTENALKCKYNTDCFLHNVLLDLLHLQRQLCISRPFGTWFLYSKKSPLFTFLWSVLEQDRRIELPPSVWKTDVLTVNTNLAYKGGEPSSPRAIFNVVFLTRWFHHKLSACFYGGFYASHTRGTT